MPIYDPSRWNNTSEELTVIVSRIYSEKHIGGNPWFTPYVFGYSKRDSNPHSRNGQRILSPSCLPFHHSSLLAETGFRVSRQKNRYGTFVSCGFGPRGRCRCFSATKIVLIREKTTFCFCEISFQLFLSYFSSCYNGFAAIFFGKNGMNICNLFIVKRKG